jgi:hypothetical protein
MSDNPESEVIPPETEVMVLHRQLQRQQFVRTNRILLFVMLALMAVILTLSSFLLSSSSDLVAELKQKQQLEITQDALKNPVTSTEVDALKSQLIGIVSGSIESKLKSLEKNIERGRPLTALETVKSLKNDVKVLRNYAKPPVVVVEKKPELTAGNAILLSEIAQLKKLTYMTLGSCGLMFAALAGIWIKGRRQLIAKVPEYLENPAAKQHADNFQ